MVFPDAASPSPRTSWRNLPPNLPNKGSGLTVILNALPLNFDGRIVLVEPKTDPDEFPTIIPPTADQG
jgi:hypothetical protein